MKKIWMIMVGVFFIGCSGGAWYQNYGLQKGQLLSTQAIPALVFALDDENDKTRVQALKCISRQKEAAADAIPGIVDFIKTESDEDIRVYAIKTLAYIMPNTKENVTILSKAIDSAKIISSSNIEKANSALAALESKEQIAPGAISINGGYVDIIDEISLKLEAKFRFYNGYITDKPSMHHYMVPIEFKIANHSSDFIKINTNSIKLLRPNGMTVSKMSLDQAKDQACYSVVKRSVVSGVAGGIIFGTISGTKAGKANAKIRKYITNTFLTDADIIPGEKKTAYIYFNCPDRPTTLEGWGLSFLCIHGSSQIFDIKYVFGEGATVSERKINEKHDLMLDKNMLVDEATLEDKLIKLKELYDKELITEQEYTQQKKRLIDKY
ncbi:Protein of unknown function [Desulfamplus magnetovallimortis]|uniref:SHOCT domain-containing protein n=1 Tax=Desulfamplus magnetovallimortis TaxID=1246637 RepID=A0A1W1HA37_9BACT|nr:SHOCT domain-containing protein [Desulfamplus magnetovallimortis]SLM29303.1 Protein of unknown function [Desulfamplus magnetovallimortis]